MAGWRKKKKNSYSKAKMKAPCWIKQSMLKANSSDTLSVIKVAASN